MQLNRRSLLAAGGGLAALILIIVLIVVLGGDDGDDVAEVAPTTTADTTTTTTTTTTVPLGPFAPLTGEPVDEDSPLLEQPAIVVKISNNDSVRDNWMGIEQADVVFEERIESEATRFAAIFHSVLPESVGPIRSGRTSDLDLLANLGNPILVYSGANGSVTGQLRGLEREGLVKLVVDRGTNVDLVRDTRYGKPDNLFSDLIEIEEKYGEEAGVAVPLFEYVHADDEMRPTGTAGDGVMLATSYYAGVYFVWDEGRGYVRVQDGDVHVTQDEVPFVFDNIVVLETPYTPSAINPGSVDAQTIGSGPVTLLIGGEQWTGTWVRETREDGFTFFDADGESLRLDPGQTWVTLAPPGTYEFTVDPEIAALVQELEG